MFVHSCVSMDFDRPSVSEGCKDLIDFVSAYTSIHCNCKGFHNGAQVDNDPLNILHNRFPHEENKWCTAQGAMVTWHESVTILRLDAAEFLALLPAQCWCLSTSSGKDTRYFPHMNSLYEEHSRRHGPARWAVLPSLSPIVEVVSGWLALDPNSHTTFTHGSLCRWACLWHRHVVLHIPYGVHQLAHILQGTIVVGSQKVWLGK